MSSTEAARRPACGRIVVLNGAPRSGKTSLARAMQQSLDGIWIHLGTDVMMAAIPERLRPGIGLRPGGERPDLEPRLPRLYAALYDTLAAHSRQGFDVVTDLGHHDHYSRPLGILPACARRLAGLPAFLIGLRAPLAAILERRRAAGGPYLAPADGEPVPAPIALWQEAVHQPGLYDLELDTARLAPEAAAQAVGRLLAAPPAGPRAFERLAQL
ncbi:chloramphenicol phosphotransferase [Aureimonas endophytica]|uniref:Chloramphenicol phosphotransferase n=1 Tax=Aureimonas endophytica TaxID=2027858 RepID=A0A916ZFW5_9HYPH|nr:AAA family ATPase [Aureimonas endophytica]GGD94872.1 chloramphenicol phosphotransferase [Aureimonas endophytica]